MNAIEFNGVWKKFRKGEKFNSLRDAIPNFLRNITSKNGNKSALGDRDFWALKDVGFQIKRGGVLGIIGPNGAGKSTILKLLSRIMAPNRGNIIINGRLSALIEVGAGFHDDLTGRENIYLNGTILGMTIKEIDRKFDDIVEFSGIREFIDTPVKRYSSGMRSRLGFSVAAHMDPDILLVDEVLAVGDMAFQAKCANKMREMLNSNVTIVLVSHNLSMIHSLCKRVMLIDKGKTVREGTAEEIIPFYQNIVYKQRREELKKKASLPDYYVKVNDEMPVKITNVTLYNGTDKAREDFNLGEPISIRVDYRASEKIDSPVFFLSIIRADGVLCCSSNTKDENIVVPSIEGAGSINIDLGAVNLAPGIYVVKVSIFDKDILHPYAVRKKDIFRIGVSAFKNSVNAVFLPKIEWRVDYENCYL